MTTAELAELQSLLERHALKYGDFILASGRKARYYFDGRRVTLSPRGAYLVGRAFLGLVRESGAEAIGGMTLGADPIVTAIAIASGLDGGRPIPAFIVRKEAKEHGVGGRIVAAYAESGDALIAPGRAVALVDDTVTTAGSILQAADAVEEADGRVALALTIVDRQEGAAEALAARGYPFRALFRADSEGKLGSGLA